MKNTLCFIVFILIIAASGCTGTTQEKPSKIIPTLPEEVIDQLKGGEIILRKGNGILSSQLIQILNEEIPLSHCGMVIKSDTSLYVIHAISDDYNGRDGVQPCTLNKFVAHAIDSSIIIIRPNYSDSILNLMQKDAMRYVKMEKTFDYQFNLDDTTQYYCTELLKHIFTNTVKEDIYPTRKLPNGFDNLYFIDFFNETYFEPVYRMKEK